MTQPYTTIVGESEAEVALRAEIERLTKERAHIIAERDKTFALMLERAEKAEAERDEARAQVAAVASKVRAECADIVEREGHGLHVALRHVAIAADAKAALEAYGREKVREGMRMAADIARECWNDPQCEADAEYIPNAILAEMEKLK